MFQFDVVTLFPEMFEAVTESGVTGRARERRLFELVAWNPRAYAANSYRTVLCLGLIVDASGRKMSKSLGNILDPWTILDSQGADALRWLLLTDGSPWVPRRVGPETVEALSRLRTDFASSARFRPSMTARLGGRPERTCRCNESR